jgi:tryptophanyl-tRNA synthetase
MKNKYQNGGYGYGHAKTDLFNLILEKYKHNRLKFDYLMSNKKEIDLILSEGAKKAEITAQQVIKRVKTKLGF